MPRARKDPESGLTQADETFCLLYVTGGEAGDKSLIGNGTACYRAAFKPKRAKDKSINDLASRKLRKVEIQSRIKALREKIVEKAVITEAEVLNIAAAMVRTSLADFYDSVGKIKDPSEWTDEMRHAAASLKTFEEYSGRGDQRELEGYVRELKLWDKNAAIERLFKYFGMFERDNRQKADPVVELLKAIDDRARLAVKS